MAQGGTTITNPRTTSATADRETGEQRASATGTSERPSPGPTPRQQVGDALRRTPARIHVGITAAVAATVAAVLTQPWMTPTDLLRDSQAVAAAHGDSSPAYGIVSNLGIVVLVMAAGTVVAAMAHARPSTGFRRPLAWGLALSLVFALDDLLLLHETAAFGPGSGTVLAAAYAVGFVAFAVRFRVTIIDRLDPALLIVAFASLGASAGIDVLVEPATRLSVIAEDGAKLLGVLAWSAFVVRAAFASLRADRTDRTSV
ncbi:hypothetical protein [Agromyces bracchium]|uniref:Uncharacterized protein n=1 Tax=Agromyces bracchium TaxID=88376 RepID=A0A6I3M4L4_9MICO|nr:hypothetical protein [Agromyces bracchium]MTH67768.1 hypothetical protein [Agromyces bracchium]